jgi:hypothetical protein
MSTLSIFRGTGQRATVANIHEELKSRFRECLLPFSSKSLLILCLYNHERNKYNNDGDESD